MDIKRHLFLKFWVFGLNVYVYACVCWCVALNRSKLTQFEHYSIYSSKNQFLSVHSTVNT